MDKERQTAVYLSLEAARQAYFDARARVVEQAPDAMAALDDAIQRYERAIELALGPRKPDRV
ncbi:MAG: hypothetical protein LH650_05860 [Chloroflexi bacterium]|nr:hypothetical protein [Chloroflexota bacterium]